MNQNGSKPSSWEPHDVLLDVQVRTRKGAVLIVRVAATEAAPGLVVHPYLDEKARQRIDAWTITHQSSGLAIYRGAETKEDALKRAQRIADLTDWTADAETVKANVPVATLKQRLAG